MEGTLGAVDRISFREGVREAALKAIARKRGCRASSWRLSKEGLRGAGFSIPVSKRVCDRRCPRRLGWGEAFSASNRGERSRRSN